MDEREVLVSVSCEGEAVEERLRRAESEVAELKKLRAEDARANEKVVSIFAAQEQGWISDRKKLKLQIQALLAQFCVLETKKEEALSDLNGKIEEKDRELRSREESLAEEVKRREAEEEKLRAAELAAAESRERAEKAAHDHSAELRRHKTAFVELVSNQRQLEAEMGRALRQVEAAKRELDEALDQKEEDAAAAERLSGEVATMQRDAEQKDKILSAMLRKSKLDTVEKQALLKEVKISKARRKQAELEAEMWRQACEPRQRRGSSRGLLRPVPAAEPAAESFRDRRGEQLRPGRSGFHPRTMLMEYLEASESGKESVECDTPKGGDAIVAGGDCFDGSSRREEDEELVTTDLRQLQDWVRSETEKYASVLEQRHYSEIEAFVEQMRIKDEKMETYRWRLLSMELESKRLQSHIERLDGNLSQFRDENLRLEALLLDKEKELKSSTERFELHMEHCQRSNNSNHCGASSEVKISKRSRLKEKDREFKATSVEDGDLKSIDEAKPMMPMESQNEKGEFRERMAASDIATTSSTVLLTNPPAHRFEDYDRSVGEGPSERTESSREDQVPETISTIRSPGEDVEEEKEVSVDPGQVRLLQTKSTETVEAVSESPGGAGRSLVGKDGSYWKMDLQALGVSYKIKRLKQQLLVLDKLAGTTHALKQQLIGKNDAVPAPDGSGGDKRKTSEEHKRQLKGFLLVTSLLNKQVKRYQSLEEKTDDLCRRLHENEQEGRTSSRDSCGVGRTREQTGALEHLLEETFQLQRYMVATGQKLTDIQSRIACSFVSSDKGGGLLLDGSAGVVDMGQFADIVRTLFRDIQRGLEVRIARIIGNLEGTLARDGILHSYRIA